MPKAYLVCWQFCWNSFEKPRRDEVVHHHCWPPSWLYSVPTIYRHTHTHTQHTRLYTHTHALAHVVYIFLGQSAILIWNRTGLVRWRELHTSLTLKWSTRPRINPRRWDSKKKIRKKLPSPRSVLLVSAVLCGAGWPTGKGETVIKET